MSGNGNYSKSAKKPIKQITEDTIMDFAAVINSINFEGSEKQVAWARDIFMSGAEAITSRRETNTIPADHDLIETVINDVEAKFFAMLTKMTVGTFPASRVIDRRHTFDFNGIAGMIDKAVLAAKIK